MKAYHEWLHVEQPLDMEMYSLGKDVAEEHFFKGFAAAQHSPLCQTAPYLQEDANVKQQSFWTKLCGNPALLKDYEAEGKNFAQQYLRDAQFVFSRVQHHVHRKDKKGEYIPLHACQRKVQKRCKQSRQIGGCKCKADFPKDNLINKSTVIICQGLAKKFKLRTSGRRNAFGLWQGPRKEAWQSGTTPAFAVHFRSNSHTMPNYRLPPTPAVHASSCPSKTCKEQAAKMLESLNLKKVSRLAQRVQREATGYYCGYTFKGQTIGRRLVLLASKSLNYMEPNLSEKTPHQQWRRVVNRMFTDICHRCTSRPAAEEFNLAAFAHDQDVTNAEFVRTFQSVNFPGAQFVKKLEHEMGRTRTQSVQKLLAVPTNKPSGWEEDVVLKYIPELYGFRGHLPIYKDVYYLSPWEFLKWWNIKRLPKPAKRNPSMNDTPPLRSGCITKVPPLTIFATTKDNEDDACIIANPDAIQYFQGTTKTNVTTLMHFQFAGLHSCYQYLCYIHAF